MTWSSISQARFTQDCGGLLVRLRDFAVRGYSEKRRTDEQPGTVAIIYDTPQSRPMAELTLRVIDGADRGRIYSDLGTPVTIGREEGNVVQLNDDRVSRFHLKIQEDQHRLVLTDLESTNGTKVNGEDIQLRILRHGDLICVGRSILLYGSPNEIHSRVKTLRGDEASDETGGHLPSSGDSSVQFDLNWQDEEELQATIHVVESPELPSGLSPAQAAQLSEMIEYVHQRIRHLLGSVSLGEGEEIVQLDQTRWQYLIDLQSRLASYLREIGEPED